MPEIQLSDEEFRQVRKLAEKNGTDEADYLAAVVRKFLRVLNKETRFVGKKGPNSKVL